MGSNYCNGIFIVIVKFFIFFLTINCKIYSVSNSNVEIYFYASFSAGFSTLFSSPSSSPSPMSILPGYPIPPPPPYLPGTTGATEFNLINPPHHKKHSHRKVNMTNPNPSSKHTNHAFIISIVVSAIGVILISLVCFAIGYWLRNKLMAPPPPPKRSSSVHQVLHSTKMVPLVPQNLTRSILTTKNTPTGRST